MARKRKNDQTQNQQAKTETAEVKQEEGQVVTEGSANTGEVEGTETTNESTTVSEGDSEGDASVVVEDRTPVTAEEREALTPVPETVAPETVTPKNEAPVAESEDVSKPAPISLGKGGAAMLEVPREKDTEGLKDDAAQMPAISKADPALYEALRLYVRDASANSGADKQKIISAQVRLFNSLCAVFNRKNVPIRDINIEIIAFVRKHKEDAFSQRLMMRNMDNIPLNQSQRTLYQQLLVLYRVAAVQGRKTAGEELDLPNLAKLYGKVFPARPDAVTVIPELFKV